MFKFFLNNSVGNTLERINSKHSFYIFYVAFSLGIEKKVDIDKPIIPTIFLEDKEVQDDDILVHVNQFNIKDEFSGKVKN